MGRNCTKNTIHSCEARVFKIRGNNNGKRGIQRRLISLYREMRPKAKCILIKDDDKTRFLESR